MVWFPWHCPWKEAWFSQTSWPVNSRCVSDTVSDPFFPPFLCNDDTARCSFTQVLIWISIKANEGSAKSPVDLLLKNLWENILNPSLGHSLNSFHWGGNSVWTKRTCFLTFPPLAVLRKHLITSYKERSGEETAISALLSGKIKIPTINFNKARHKMIVNWQDFAVCLSGFK